MSNPVAEVVTALVKPAEKLIGAISKGIGALYEPHRIKKLADAEAYKIKTIGQALSENSDLPVKYNNGKISADLTEYENLQKRAVCRFARQETQRQFNIESIADKAYDLLQNQQAQSNETVSQDWMTRFINNAQDVSDEEIQTIWANILSQEVVKPNSISLRTLDILKNISKDDALLFNKVSQAAIRRGFIPRNDKILKKYNIFYGEILRLDEIGLINSASNIQSQIDVDAHDYWFAANRHFAIKAYSETKRKLIVNQYPLTQSGQEILIALKHEMPDDLVIEYCEILKAANPSMHVELTKVVIIDENKQTKEENE